jgi:hypothetical protein
MSEVLFRAPSKYPFGFTEEQMKEAVALYTRKMQRRIVAELMLENPLLEGVLEEDSSMLELLYTTVDKALSRGMEMIVDKHLVYQHYQEHLKKQAKPTSNPTRYKFREGMGLCGILLPDGEFRMCGNAEHYMLTSDMEFELQTQCVYFSSMLNGDGGNVTLSPFGEKRMTGAQMGWVSRHGHYMDENQHFMYDLLKEEQQDDSEV